MMGDPMEPGALVYVNWGSGVVLYQGPEKNRFIYGHLAPAGSIGIVIETGTSRVRALFPEGEGWANREFLREIYR